MINTEEIENTAVQEGTDKKEDKNRGTKKEKKDVESAIKDFVEQGIKKEGVNFYNSVKEFADNPNSSTNSIILMIQQFEEFLTTNSEDYSGNFNVNKKNAGLFLKYALFFGINIAKSRDIALNLIKKRFVDKRNVGGIISSTVEDSLKEAIEKKSQFELDEIIDNDDKKAKLIKEVTKEEVGDDKNFQRADNFKDVKEKIKACFGKDIEDTSFNGKREAVTAIFEQIKRCSYVTKDDIMSLLKVFDDNDEQKRKIVEHYMPVVTIGELLGFGVIEENKILEIIKEIIKNNEGIKEILGIKNVNDIESLKLILAEKSIRDIKLETSDLLENLKNIDIEVTNELINKGAITEIIVKTYNGNIDVEWQKKIESQVKLEITDANGNPVDQNVSNINEVGTVDFDFKKKLGELELNKDKNENDKDKKHYENKVKGVDKFGDFDIQTGDGFVFSIQTGDGKYLNFEVLETDVGPAFAPFKKIKYLDRNSQEEGYIDYTDLYNIIAKSKSCKIESKEEFDVTKIETLNTKLDSIDKSGAEFKLNSAMPVHFTLGDINESGNDSWVYSVKQDKDGKLEIRDALGVLIENGEGGEISFEDFYKIFESYKGKRVGSIITPEGLLNALKSHGTTEDTEYGSNSLQKDYEKMEFKNGKFVVKGESNEEGQEGGEKEKEISYFKGSKGEMLKIVSISGNTAKIEYGKYKITPTKEKKDDKPETKLDKFIPEEKGEGKIEYIYYLINKYNLKPFDPTFKNMEEEMEEKIKAKELESKNNWFKSLLSGGISINKLMMTGKIVKESLENHIKQMSDEQADEMAVKIGEKIPFFPEDLQLVLISRRQEKYKELLDKKINQITIMSRKERMIAIKSILTCKQSKPYEIVAAMMACLKKHGTLYPDEMREYEGSLAWTRALMRSSNDNREPKSLAQYGSYWKKEYQENREAQFREEDLIDEYLLGYVQKNNLLPQDTNKKFKGAVAEGIRSEMEDGSKKCGDRATMRNRVEYGVYQVEVGDIANAVGSIASIFGKEGDASEAQMVPFLLTIGGFTERMPEALVKEYQGLFWKGHYSPFLWFCRDNDIKMVKHVTLKAAYSVGADQGKALETLIERGTKIMDAKSRVKYVRELRSFWEENGIAINHVLNFSRNPEFLLKQEKDKENDPMLKDFSKTLYTLVTHDLFRPTGDQVAQYIAKDDFFPFLGEDPGKIFGKICSAGITSEGTISGKPYDFYKNYFKYTKEMILGLEKTCPNRYKHLTNEEQKAKKLKEDQLFIYKMANEGLRSFFAEKVSVGRAGGFFEDNKPIMDEKFVIPTTYNWRNTDESTSATPYSDDEMEEAIKKGKSRDSFRISPKKIKTKEEVEKEAEKKFDEYMRGELKGVKKVQEEMQDRTNNAVSVDGYLKVA
ncbi:MAG: hypothetical protein PHF46_00145 [Candidatus Gracilibacteria bacterium]|nr:hypothetical protein [Candidatus Gracilibacteria bacterium]